MRQAIHLTMILSLGAFFTTLTAAQSNLQSAAKTEKLKIVSACCLNGKWNFNIYDGVVGKTMPLKLGKANALGYKLQSFDESTQMAILQTPRGNFSVTMNEAQPYSASETKTEAKDLSENETGLEKPAERGRISRKQILERIK